jgi:hypothetical protein
MFAADEQNIVSGSPQLMEMLVIVENDLIMEHGVRCEIEPIAHSVVWRKMPEGKKFGAPKIYGN